jgi:PmbA protein
MSRAPSSILDFLDNLVAMSLKAGADAADAMAAESRGTSVECRLGKLESLDHHESHAYGLRVLIGTQQALVSASDFSKDTVQSLVERAIAMAKIAPPDPFLSIASPDMLATSVPELDLYDATEPTFDTMWQLAHEAEDTARAVAGVTNSDGASFGWGKSRSAMVISNGFREILESSSFSLSASVIAESAAGMESDYEFSTTCHFADLTDAKSIGKRAGEGAVKRLNPRKPLTQVVPVIFDPRVARGLVGCVASACNGAAIARNTSFLKEALGTAMMPAGIHIIDDPLRKRGLSSYAVDAEGIAASTQSLVEDGVLKQWFLDLRSAKQLGLTTNGHASRGFSSPPSPSSSNLYLTPGPLSPAELMADIKEGLYVTELSGMGINLITGDYSQGASGFWIENGKIAYPVSELTIASTLQTMLKTLVPANDLEFRYGTNAPTIRIASMTVAGT